VREVGRAIGSDSRDRQALPGGRASLRQLLQKDISTWFISAVIYRLEEVAVTGSQVV